MRIDILQIPMYELYYIDNSQEELNIDDEFLVKLKEIYNTKKINKIFEGLEWAVKNSDYDFSSLLPDLPADNKEIFKYLSRWHKCLQQNKDFLGIK